MDSLTIGGIHGDRYRPMRTKEEAVSDPFYSTLATLYDDVVVDPCFPAWAEFLTSQWADDGVVHIIDVGCGTGLLAEQLMARGCTVVGIDGSSAMLAEARSRLGPDVVLVESTLPAVPNLGPFDAAVSTFDTLNYLTPEAMATTMAAVGNVLSAGAWWVFDLHTDALMELVAEQPLSAGEQQGWTFSLTSTVDRAARTCRTQFSATHSDGARKVAEDHLQYFFTDDAVRHALVEAGFDRVRAVDEYSERPVTDTTLRATWMARKLG